MKTNNSKEDKNNLRQKIKSLRDLLSPEDRIQKSNAIAEKLFKLEEYKQAKNILLYYPFRSEVDTRIIINDALKKEKKIALPKVEDHNISFYYINSILKDISSGYYGIMEPISTKCLKVNLNEFDLAIIPAVCIDKNLNRLGYGEGYYDRLISKIDKRIFKIALCFEIQVVDHIPIQKYDKKVNMVITEERIIREKFTNEK